MAYTTLDGLPHDLVRSLREAAKYQENPRLFELGRVFPKSGEYVALAIGVSGKKTDKILDETKKVLERELGIKIPENSKEGILEINFSKLLEKLPEAKNYEGFEQNLTPYKDFSLYPFVLRDTAVWIPSSVDEKEILNVIEEHGGKLLINKTKFDEFEKVERCHMHTTSYFNQMSVPLQTMR